MEQAPVATDDIRARVVALEHRHNDVKVRVVAVEKWQNEQSIANAVRDERWATMLVRLNKIDSNLSKVVWLMVGAFIAAVMAFVIGGGLRLPLGN